MRVHGPRLAHSLVVARRPLPGRRLQDVVHAQNHLRRLAGRDDNLRLDLEALGDAEIRNVGNLRTRKGAREK